MSAVEELGLEEAGAALAAESFRGVVIDFWSPWCAPCRVLRPHLDRLAGERPGWRFVAVNTEEHPGAVERFAVRSLPTLVFFRRGDEIERLTGGVLVSRVVETLDALDP